jgi:hypothetical protein
MNWIYGMACIHNPKVGGSIPPPATSISHDISDLRFKPEIAISLVGGKMGQESARFSQT